MTSPHKISISSEQKRIEELEEALRNLIAARGAPGRDEYLNDEAFREANAAHSAAVAALSKVEGK